MGAAMKQTDSIRSLRSINLNLLPILRELLRHRNVTRAAEKLNLTQSGVSEALGRLRLHFEDELLIRVGRSMVPTPLAIALAPRVEEVLSELETLLQPVSFDPARVKRQFIIATGDTIILALGKELIQRLGDMAPHASIQFISIQYVTKRDLEEGKIDFLIIPRDVIPPAIFDEEGLSWMKIYREDWVCVSRKDHPALRNGLTVETLNSVPSIACRLDENSYLHGAIPGRPDFDRLRVSQFTLLPMLAAQSDAIAMVQRHVARWFADLLPIDIFELPIHFPALDVCAYWAPIHGNDQMHGWLRKQMEEISAQPGNPWLPG
jgi:LysR family nod box-dependent transcriptional activator